MVPGCPAVQVVRVPRPSSSEVQAEAERWQKRLHQQFGQRLAAAGVEHELHVLVHPAAGETPPPCPLQPHSTQPHAIHSNATQPTPTSAPH